MTNKIKHFSTAHITQNDGAFIRNDESNAFAQICGGYGTIFYISEDQDEFEEQKNNLKECGYSAAFIDLFDLTFKEGAAYLCLDNGIPVDENLPQFKWE